MAKLANEVTEKVLQVVHESQNNITKVRLIRRLWFKRHCGERMVKVKTYYQENGREERGLPQYVCVRCFAVYNWGDFHDDIEDEF